MAMKCKSVAGAAMALLVVLAMVLEAHAACPTPYDMAACQPTVTTVNAVPTLSCCQKVKQVLAQPGGAKCLCDVMTSPAAVTFKVIKAEAIKLPSKCKKLMGLQYTSGYNCDGSMVP